MSEAILAAAYAQCRENLSRGSTEVTVKCEWLIAVIDELDARRFEMESAVASS